MSKYYRIAILWLTFPVSATLLFLIWVWASFATMDSRVPIDWPSFVYAFKYWYLGFENN